MIFYEDVYKKINEDYLNGEISYEMAEAANDLAYNNYITIEEAKNITSSNPDPAKTKNLLSKLSTKLYGIVTKCVQINKDIENLKKRTDIVESYIDKLNANGDRCVEGKIKNPKKSISDFINDKKSVLVKKSSLSKTTLDSDSNIATYKEYKDRENAIKAAVKNLQQELVKIAGDTSKLAKEYLLIIYTNISSESSKRNAVAFNVGSFVGGAIGTGASVASTIAADRYAIKHPDNSNKINKLRVSPAMSSAVGSGVGVGVGLAVNAIHFNKIKKVIKESGAKSAISKNISDIEAFAKKLGVTFDTDTTVIFTKLKKSK